MKASSADVCVRLDSFFVELNRKPEGFWTGDPEKKQDCLFIFVHVVIYPLSSVPPLAKYHPIVKSLLARFNISPVNSNYIHNFTFPYDVVK